MPNIVVLIKQVPDTASERKLSEDDYTLDRESADAILDEINEKAVEEALQITEAQGGEVVLLTVGPERSTDAIRKALSMGADRAVHVQDDALKGSDAVQTAYALAAAIGQIEGAELIMAGNEATDGTIGAVPAIVAEYLGIPALTHMSEVTVADGAVSGRRETDEGSFQVEASMPAVVSVTERINEPRFPAFKGIMAAKKKPVEVLGLADIGVDPSVVGVANASSQVTGVTPKPARTAGEKVADEGNGGADIAAYLVGQKLI